VEHLGTKIIETERLILRGFVLDDAGNMFKNWANDDEVTKYLMWPSHQNIDVSKHVLQQWIPNYEKKDYYSWAIVLKEINEAIGNIAAVKQSDEINMVHMGYCIGKNWWNKGIVSEALTAVMKFFFEEVGVNRIESRHDPNNPNSGKVMLKCGMKQEGCLKQADWNNQGIVDTVFYGILRKDYFK
jgi:ribosomal-protein-alanine N-acetyltransferase